MAAKKGGLSNVKSIKSAFEQKTVKKDKPYVRNYSRKEVIEKIDMMAQIAKEKKDRDNMLDIKDGWYKHHHNLQVNRGIQKEHLRQSINHGSADRNAMDRIEKNFDLTDQKNRNVTMKKAKSYYHRHYSMSKHFENVQPKTMTKTRSLDMNNDR